MAIDRRALLQCGLGVALASAAAGPAAAARFINRTGLAAGQFVWEPSQPAQGPVLVVVSLHDRLVHVFKDGRIVGISTCRLSGGRKPAGVFVLTADGLHEQDAEASEEGPIWTAAPLDAHNGLLDARSMGFVRLPDKFAALLNEVAMPGTVVVLAPRRTPAREIAYPAFLELEEQAHAGPLGSISADAAGSRGAEHGKAEPSLCILVSVSDAEATVLRDGIPSGSLPVEVMEPQERLGTHVYFLLGQDSGSGNLRWLALGLAGSSNDPALITWEPETAISRVSFTRSAEAGDVVGTLRPGATLIITDKPMPLSRRRSLRGAVILASEGRARAESRTASRPFRRRYAAGP